MKCRKCRIAELEQPAKGRKREFCSSACRRAAEYEIRRLDRRLGTLEDSDANWRDPNRGWTAGQRRKNLEFVASEIERVRTRMQVLLSDLAVAEADDDRS